MGDAVWVSGGGLRTTDRPCDYKGKGGRNSWFFSQTCTDLGQKWLDFLWKMHFFKPKSACLSLRKGVRIPVRRLSGTLNMS